MGPSPSPAFRRRRPTPIAAIRAAAIRRIESSRFLTTAIDNKQSVSQLLLANDLPFALVLTNEPGHETSNYCKNPLMLRADSLASGASLYIYTDERRRELFLSERYIA